MWAGCEGCGPTPAWAKGSAPARVPSPGPYDVPGRPILADPERLGRPSPPSTGPGGDAHQPCEGVGAGDQAAVRPAAHLADQGDGVVHHDVVVQRHDPCDVRDAHLVHVLVRSLPGVEQGHIEGAVLRDGGRDHVGGRPRIEGLGGDVQAGAARCSYLFRHGGGFGGRRAVRTSRLPSGASGRATSVSMPEEVPTIGTVRSVMRAMVSPCSEAGPAQVPASHRYVSRGAGRGRGRAWR